MSLANIMKHRPLVHCMTNYVVAQFTANGLLAVGASPVMADAVEEAAHIASQADALLLNIGTLHAESVRAMYMAGAHSKGPIVLDPVGAGASPYRLKTALSLLQTLPIQLLRCNKGELAAIAGIDWQAKGVDEGQGDMDVPVVATQIARQYECIVIVTGEIDIISDGTRISYIAGGDECITRLTGSGCLLSALCAASLASSDTPFETLVQLLKDYKHASAQASGQLGTMQQTFINCLAQLAEVVR